MQGTGRSTQAKLVFDGVACRRGGRLLFADISFALMPGDALIVSGPNGVGKSSLLRLAAGLLEALEGRIERLGSVALADERPALDVNLPLQRALGFWVGIDGGDALSALRVVGMDHLCEVPVRMLSTGQRRRATLARTILSGADVWLLDEPGNGLDTASLGLLEASIAVHRAGGGIVVVASHQGVDVPDAQRLELSSLFLQSHVSASGESSGRSWV